jgi:hypothetical protein
MKMTTGTDVLDRCHDVAPLSARRVASDLARLVGLALVYGIAFGLLLTAAAVAVSTPLNEGGGDNPRRAPTEGSGVVVAERPAGGAE